MSNSSTKVVTRFAPSPTGFMHVGGIRTALYAYLWARKNNGTFILRIEDTDKEREVEGSIEHIIKSLKWLGINWDEGPDISGPNAPYLQSQRLESYKKYAQILIDKGLAYLDPYTEEEVEAFRKQAEEAKKPFLFREHRPKKEDPITNISDWYGKKPLRLKVPEIKRFSWHDLVYGDLSAGEEALDDFILIKSDGYPTYNFAHIIDDLEMEVTHVMRGQEFISSTPKYLSLYEALSIEPPLFATLPPIMGKDGKKKLGKRDGAKDVLDYQKEGYLPEAMINFLAFLGWNPGGEKEIYSKKELEEIFDISRIGHSGAQWNDDKLDWINKEYIKLLDEGKLKEEIFAHLPQDLHNKKLIPLIAERISKFGDVDEMVKNGELDYFYKMPEYQKEKLIFKDSDPNIILKNLNESLEVIKNTEEEDFTKENIKIMLMELADKAGSRGEVLHPVRFGLSGLDKSPDPFTIADILGKTETISRLEKAIQLLTN